MSRFTPGPWEWIKISGRYILWAAHGKRRVILDPDVRTIDETPVIRMSDDDGYLKDVKPENADAALIAAAPEMYEALEEMIEGIHRWANDEDNTIPEPALTAYKHAQAVLRKAIIE